MNELKVAFSTTACPEWTIDEVARRAAEMGYQGVELRTLGPGGSGLASDPALGEPGRTRSALEDAGVEPVCLTTSIQLDRKDPGAVYQAHWQALEMIDLAVELGCPAIRVLGCEVGVGEDPRAVMRRIADQTRDLADKALDKGVQILFENAGSLAVSKQWWWLMELLEHPMVGLAWNFANAWAAGEPASVGIPNLHSRIRLAKLKDTEGDGSGYVPLGDGDVGVTQIVKRLMGVGYPGYLSVEWDRMWLPKLAPAEEYLPDALSRLKKIFDDIYLFSLSPKERKQVEKDRAEAAAAKKAEQDAAEAGEEPGAEEEEAVAESD